MIIAILLSLIAAFGAAYSVFTVKKMADINEDLKNKMKQLNKNLNFLKDQNISIKKKLELFKENILSNKDKFKDIIDKIEILEEQIETSKENIEIKSIINKEKQNKMIKSIEEEVEKAINNLHNEILGEKQEELIFDLEINKKEQVISSKIEDKKELVVELPVEEFIEDIKPKEELNKIDIVEEKEKIILEDEINQRELINNFKEEIIENKEEEEEKTIFEIVIKKEERLEEKNIKENINLNLESEEANDLVKVDEAIKVDEKRKEDKFNDEDFNYCKREKKPELSKKIKVKKKILEPTGQAIWSFKLKDYIDKLIKFEYWLIVLGIIMLSVGVLFIFKLSYDKGIISDSLIKFIKIVSGLGVGLILEFFGFKLNKKRKVFSQILLGGGIAILYIVIFGSFYLEYLNSFILVFIMMTGLTIYAMILSIKQNEMALSLIGFLGGILTPFLLNINDKSLVGLILYLMILILGAGIIYLIKAWISYLWIIAATSLILIITCIFRVDEVATNQILAIQIGMVIYCITFWFFPVLREVLYQRNSEKWTKADLNYLRNIIKVDYNKFIDKHVHLLIFIIPITCFYLSLYLFKKSNVLGNIDKLGYISMLLSFFYFLVSSILRKIKIKDKYDSTHIFVAITFLTNGFIILLRGDIEVLIAALAIEGIGLLYLSKYLEDKIMKKIGILAFVILGICLETNLLFGNKIKNVLEINNELSTIPFLNLDSLMYILIIICGLISIRFIQNKWIKKGFQLLFGHISIITLIFIELSPVENSYHFIALLLVIQVLVEYIIAKKQKNKMMKNVSHIVFAIIVFLRLLDYIKIIFKLDFLYETNESLRVLLDIRSTVDIIIIIIGFIMYSMQKSNKKSNSYKFFAYLAIFGLVWREFYRVGTFGLELVIIAWTIEVIVMHLIAYKKKDKFLENTTHYAFVILGCIIGSKILDSIYKLVINEGVDKAFINKGFSLEMLVILVAIGLSYLFDKNKKTIYQFVSFNYLFIMIGREAYKINYGVLILLILIVPVTLYYLYNKKDNRILKTNYLVLFLIVAVIEIGKLLFEIYSKSNIIDSLNFYLLVDILVLVIGYIVFRKDENKKHFMLFAYIIALLLITKLVLFLGINALMISYFIYFMIIEYVLGKIDYKQIRNTNTALLGLTFLGVIFNELYEFAINYTNIYYTINKMDTLFKFIIVGITLFNIFRRKKTKYFIPLVLCLHTYLLIFIIKEFTLLNQSYNLLIYVLAIYTVLVSQISSRLKIIKLEYCAFIDIAIVLILFIGRVINVNGGLDIFDDKIFNILSTGDGKIYLFDFIIILLIGLNSIFNNEKQKKIGIITLQIMTILFIINAYTINKYFVLLIILDLFLLHFIFNKKNDEFIRKSNLLTSYGVNILIGSSVLCKFFTDKFIGDILIGILLLGVILYTYIRRSDKKYISLQYKIFNLIIYVWSVSFIELGIWNNSEYFMNNFFSKMIFIAAIFAIINFILFYKNKNKVFKECNIFFMILLGIAFVIQVPWKMITDVFYLLGQKINGNIFYLRLGLPIINIKLLSNITFIIIILFNQIKNISKKRNYIVESLFYFGTMFLIYREFSGFEASPAFISIMWGVFAVSLLVYGLRSGDKIAIRTTIITLLLIVVKVILVDLEFVNVIWKIVLFMGFGVVFILISYFMQILWKPKDEVKE